MSFASLGNCLVRNMAATADPLNDVRRFVAWRDHAPKSSVKEPETELESLVIESPDMCSLQDTWLSSSSKWDDASAGSRMDLSSTTSA